MIHRILSAGLAVVGVISLFIPITASARAGGSAGGFHGGFRAPVFHAVRPAHAARPALTHAFPARIGFRGAHLRDRRLARFPVWPDYGSFDPFYYYPPDYAASYAGAAVASPDADGASAPQPPNRVMVYTPGCRTQTQTVPSESGGTRAVNITRCY